MQELTKQLQELLARIRAAMVQLGIAADQAELSRLESVMQAADFWADSAAAAAVSQRAASLRKHIEDWSRLEAEAGEALELARLGDDGLRDEISASYRRLAGEYARREFELKLSGPYDKNAAILSVYAGTGGTDAQDWAEMLLRMYLRYAQAAGFKTDLLDQSPGEEAGLKSVTAEISGPFAYGKLKSEKGVHRLVRLSPFNSDNLRQTSFALVDVVPQLDQTQEFEIDSKELRVDVFRAGGHGGQSVNTTDSAVRITHLPTGLVVAIQNERSQLQNKEKAMAVLKARLTALMLEQHKAEVSEIRGATQAAAWGNQIRSYVLHPYTKVKDHRTGAETAAAQAVLDGQLDSFIEAYLQSQIGAEAVDGRQ
ncbi:peptide chain release factor 2 [Candidatus Parcubacteria bacterium]|nr:peptide chain release factor 2 [Candidatus Parcubacteria bacterium]